MQDLYLDIKRRFGKLEITQIDSEIIEVVCEKGRDSIIVQKGFEQNRYIVSYPKIDLKSKKIEYQNSTDILDEGVFWIISQVEKKGSVT